MDNGLCFEKYSFMFSSKTGAQCTFWENFGLPLHITNKNLYRVVLLFFTLTFSVLVDR